MRDMVPKRGGVFLKESNRYLRKKIQSSKKKLENSERLGQRCNYVRTQHFRFIRFVSRISRTLVGHLILVIDWHFYYCVLLIADLFIFISLDVGKHKDKHTDQPLKSGLQRLCTMRWHKIYKNEPFTLWRASSVGKISNYLFPYAIPFSSFFAYI